MIQCCLKEHLRLIKQIHSPLKEEEISGTFFFFFQTWIKTNIEQFPPHISQTTRVQETACSVRDVQKCAHMHFIFTQEKCQWLKIKPSMGKSFFTCYK